jgi:hypothetical protein
METTTPEPFGLVERPQPSALQLSQTNSWPRGKQVLTSARASLLADSLFTGSK